MSRSTPPTYADKIKQSLEHAADLGQAPPPSPAAAESVARSNAQVLGDRPSISEKAKGPGALYRDPANEKHPSRMSYDQPDVTEQLRQQAVNRSGPNYMPEAEEPGRTESFEQRTGPSFTDKAKQKLSDANESLKESVTRGQQKLNEAMSGGIQEKAGEVWDRTKSAVTPDEQQPSIMDRLTTSIAEGSKKVTQTAQDMSESVKSTLGIGSAGEATEPESLSKTSAGAARSS